MPESRSDRNNTSNRPRRYYSDTRAFHQQDEETSEELGVDIERPHRQRRHIGVGNRECSRRSGTS